MPSDNSWITETLIQFTRSPVWRTPVNDFVDEHCGVFDNDEEMKLEYTTIHTKFRTLVDGLLTDFVGEIGIPLTEALEAVKATMADRSSANYKPLKRLMNYVYMVEDFRSFHSMMVKRNIELDILATAALEAYGVDLSVPRTEQAAPTEEERRLAEMANGDMDEETAIQNAIAASLAEQQDETKKLELEDAELREALALSIQEEKDRARRSAEVVEREAQQLRQHDAVAAEKMRAEKLKAIEEQKEMTIQKLTANIMEARHANEKRRKVILGKEMSAPASPDLVDEPGSATPTPTPSLAPTSAPTTKQAAPALPPVSKPAGGALPPIGGSSASAPLPPIQVGGALKPLASTGAGDPGAKPSAPTATTTSTKTAASAQPSKAELEARAQHMKEQRARILAQNKAKRQQELNNFTSSNGTPAPEGTADPNAAAQKQLTVDIARRLREDMVREATKKN